MERKKIVLIGGGSYHWMPHIVKDMLLTESISASEFVLYDIDRNASDLVAAFLEKLNADLGTSGTIVSTDDRKAAFTDADYFVITISTGGLDAMAYDLSIPEEYGIYHTVGDTSGPGGWARFVRNFEVFVSLAEDMNRYAGDAVVLNYTNPMTTLTEVLARICTGPVIGLCHGLFENIAKLVGIYGLESEDELALNYGGLNHFFWVTDARTKELDVASDLRERVAEVGLTKLLDDARADRDAEPEIRDLATALFNETGVMPYFGDRHTCEFFPCYITSTAAMEQYRLVRTSIEERKQKREKQKTRLEEMIAGEIADEYRSRSRETAANIIAAHATGGVFIDVGNVPNVGQISNLPAGVVVETAVRVDRNGFSPIVFGALPASVAGFVEPCARSLHDAVDACFAKDKAAAVRALRIDPVCALLTGDQVSDLANNLLQAHRDFPMPFGAE